jgi:hypothetical protein
MSEIALFRQQRFGVKWQSDPRTLPHATEGEEHGKVHHTHSPSPNHFASPINTPWVVASKTETAADY